MKIHIVQLGDTLWKLAEKYNASFEELKKVNSHLANPEKLMPGMKIKIPGATKQVQKGTSKKEQMTPVSKKEKTTKKEQKTLPFKEEVKSAKKEQPKPVQKEEKKKTEHPYKQKTPTPIAVLKEDDQKEKKKEQFEAVMPKMPKVPSMPILEKEPKSMQKPIKKEEPPKKQQKEKTAPSMEQPAGKEVPQQQEAFEFEAYQHPPAIPCEPVPFCPPMMPVFFMPCPPMPHFNPYGMHPGMQQGFPMMPPMHAGGDCGCGGNQNQSGPMQATFNPVPMGFNEMQYEGGHQQFQGMMPYQPEQTVNQMNRQGPAPDIYTSANNATASKQTMDNSPVSPDKPSQMPTSASFMDDIRRDPGVAENRQYAYFNPTPLSNSPENSFYPKPPFFPEQSKDKHDSSS